MANRSLPLEDKKIFYVQEWGRNGEENEIYRKWMKLLQPNKNPAERAMFLPYQYYD